MPTQDAFNKCTEAVSRLTAFDVSSLHVDDRPAVSLADAHPIVEQIKSILRPFTPDVVELLDDNSLNRIRIQTDSITPSFAKAAQFRPETGQAARDQILNELRGLLEQVWRELRHDYTFAMVRQFQPETIEANIEAARAAAAKDLRDALTATVKKSEDLLNELQQTAESAKLAAGLTGAAANATFFDTAAQDQAKEAKAWGSRGRWAVGWLGLAVIVVVILPFVHKAGPWVSWLKWENTEGAAQLIAIKLLIVVPLLYWIVLAREITWRTSTTRSSIATARTRYRRSRRSWMPLRNHQSKTSS